MFYKFCQLSICTLGLAIALTAPADTTFKPTAKLSDMPNNSWIKVDQGSISAPLGIMAYSGGWYDPQHHQFCIFGGGHWNYSGNEVWCLDITSLTWREMYVPDVVTNQEDDQGAYKNYNNSRYPGALFNPAGEPIENTNPMSKHTYDQMEYVEGLGPVVWGGYSWGDGGQGWCELCKDTWSFNFSSASWQYHYNGSNPSPNSAAGVGASAYSSADKLLYVLVTGKTWTFSPANKKWRQISTSGKAPWSIEMTMEYDPKRNVLYTFGGSYPDNPHLHRFDIDTHVWTKLSPNGIGPGTGSVPGAGLAYDTSNDVLLVLKEGTIWAYDPETNSWSKSRTKDQPTANDNVFGRFRYDPINEGVWYHGWQNDQHTTWFYRYKAGR
jgi:hypothetical protein